MQPIRGREGSGKRLDIMDISLPQSSSVHSCCKKSQKRKTLLSYLAAILAAFLACLCCSIPLIPLMLGLSAGSSLVSLTKNHMLFDLLGGLMLLGSLVWIWREHKEAEKSVWRNRQFWTCLVVTFTMYAAMNFVVKQIVASKLTSVSGHSHEHAEKVPISGVMR